MRQPKWIHAGLCAGLLLTGASAAAQPSERPPGRTEPTSAGDQNFLIRALRLNQLLLRIGRLARESGSSPEVRAEGEAMVQRYSDVARELSDQALEASIEPRASLTALQAATLTRLERLSGPAFDSAFRETIPMLREQELAMYKDEATRATAPELRALSEARVEHLQATLEHEPPTQMSSR